jgi:hypothetical protein
MGVKNYNKYKEYHEYDTEQIEYPDIDEKMDYWDYIYDDNGDFKLRFCF